MACPCSWGWFAESVFSHAWKTISNSHRTAPWSQLKQKIYFCNFQDLNDPYYSNVVAHKFLRFFGPAYCQVLGGQWISEFGFTWIALKTSIIPIHPFVIHWHPFLLSGNLKTWTGGFVVNNQIWVLQNWSFGEATFPSVSFCSFCRKEENWHSVSALVKISDSPLGFVILQNSAFW